MGLKEGATIARTKKQSLASGGDPRVYDCIKAVVDKANERMDKELKKNRIYQGGKMDITLWVQVYANTSNSIMQSAVDTLRNLKADPKEKKVYAEWLQEYYEEGFKYLLSQLKSLKETGQ